MIFLKLFYTFLLIGVFTFGGGYAMLSLIQDQVVVNNAWITAEQLTDIVAISQATPGPVGINIATYVGYTVPLNMGYSPWACVGGSLIATLAVVIPSFIIVLAICKLYQRVKKSDLFKSLMKEIRPVVIGMIAAAAGILITPQNFFHWSNWLLLAGAFISCKFFKVNPIWVIIAGGLIGLAIY
jgi:chromate transporter